MIKSIYKLECIDIKNNHVSLRAYRSTKNTFIVA